MQPYESPVTVIGLGAMGRALAAAFVAAGHPTTVWNRTPGRARDLVAAGATEAPDLQAALDPATLVVVCLLDRAALEAVLDDAGADAWRGRTVVNLTSSTSDDARALDERFRALGAAYLDGTVMVTTDLVGTDDGHVLYGGDPAVFARHEAALAALGGTAELLGADPSLPATYDLAMLDLYVAGMAAFLHAVALVGADGVAARDFLPYARRMLDLLDPTVEDLAADVDRHEHPGTADNLRMELRFLDHIVATSEARGLDPGLPTAVRALVADAVAAGHGADGFSRVIDVIRSGPSRRAAA